MAANIVVVQDHSDFLDRTTTALQVAGYDAAFLHPCFAIPTQPITGFALARISRVKRPWRQSALRYRSAPRPIRTSGSRPDGSQTIGHRKAPLAAISYLLLRSSEFVALPRLVSALPRRRWPKKPHTPGTKTSEHPPRDAAARPPGVGERLQS
jgi:hypothetical protein